MHDKKKVTQLNDTKTLFFLKPMMNISEMIIDLKQKNVKFNLITEEAAKDYLKYNNNYYNITSFKHNFQKYPSPAGKYEGLYQNLDFAYLKDLAIIDYRVRLILFKIIINIEHYLKLQILNTIDTMKLENGYTIVNMYLENDFNNTKFPKKVHNNILKKIDNEYYRKIFSKYEVNMNKKIENIPIWEFLEIITFGELVNFYDFYTKQYNLLEENKDVYILKAIVKLRNAVAHNACILCELNKKDINYSASYKVIQYLKDCNIGKTTRDNKLSNSRIRQITYTLYMFNRIVTSDGVKENTSNELNELFFSRIVLHSEYYNNNELLKSVYKYFKNIIQKNYSSNNKNV